MLLIGSVSKLKVMVDDVTRLVNLKITCAEDQTVSYEDHGVRLQVLVH